MLYTVGMEHTPMKKATFRVSEAMWREFRSYCVRNGRQTSEVLRELINRYIIEHRGKGK